MKTFVIGKISRDASGAYTFPLTIGKGPSARTVQLSVDESGNYDPESPQPQQWAGKPGDPPNGIWFFRHSAVSVEDANATPLSEVSLRVKHAVLREEKAFARLMREVEAFENMERIPSARRDRIPDSVRLFVWQRDEGKCVRCGSVEKLEFDHIIPIVKGGANTERNIQLLCESCNRAKGAAI